MFVRNFFPEVKRRAKNLKKNNHRGARQWQFDTRILLQPGKNQTPSRQARKSVKDEPAVYCTYVVLKKKEKGQAFPPPLANGSFIILFFLFKITLQNMGKPLPLHLLQVPNVRTFRTGIDIGKFSLTADFAAIFHKESLHVRFSNWNFVSKRPKEKSFPFAVHARRPQPDFRSASVPPPKRTGPDRVHSRTSIASAEPVCKWARPRRGQASRVGIVACRSVRSA